MNDRSDLDIYPHEIIPLYRLLRARHGETDNTLIGLLDRIERRLYTVLSIEEIESIPKLNEVAVEALSKKL